MTNVETIASRARPLVAHTAACDPVGSLLDRLEPDGFGWLRNGAGFVTGGIAARVRADSAEAALERITVEDCVGTSGTGAIAVGSLPFRGAAAATMTIPAWVEGRHADGSAWRTEIGPATNGGPDGPARPVQHRGTGDSRNGYPGPIQTQCLAGRDAWDHAVRAVLDAITTGALTKVVLARCVQVDAAHPIDPVWLLRRLERREPDRYLYAHDGIVGASPELLVRRAGSAITSRPLAGTAVRPEEHGALTAMAESAKQRHEHAVVVDAIARTLGSSCTDLTIGPTDVLRLADVAHLATTIHANAGTRTPGALGLALALHPTPAVGGTPNDLALEYIDQLEPWGRGRFAGPVGWVDAAGDGEFAVALRCAQIDGSRALVHAGAGIVAGSESDAEWTEIDAKLTPVLRALTAR